jgi:hypothetical protein
VLLPSAIADDTSSVNAPFGKRGNSKVKIQGGCLCGGIRYEIDGPLSEVSNCHCSMCRRFHGAAFATYGKVGADHFHWLSGQELLQVYETTPGTGWAFCRVCGSSLGVPTDGKLSDLTLGTLDADPGVRPAEHIFVGSKAGWYDITDDLPQHDTWPPGRTK